MTEFSGALEGIGLSRLVRFLIDLEANGALSLEEAPFSGKLYFDNGNVCGARFGSEEGAAALEAIALTLGPGRFAFAPELTEPEIRNLNFQGNAIVGELDRLAAESERYRRLMPPLSSTPVPKRSSEAEDESVTLDRGTWQLLLDCNGRTTVADLVYRGSMLATLKRLARLIELGMIDCQPVERSRAASARSDSESSAARQQRASRSPQLEEAEPAMHADGRAGLATDVSRWKWRRGQ